MNNVDGDKKINFIKICKLKFCSLIAVESKQEKVASNVFAIATVASVRSSWILLEATFNSSLKLNEVCKGQSE